MCCWNFFSSLLNVFACKAETVINWFWEKMTETRHEQKDYKHISPWLPGASWSASPSLGQKCFSGSPTPCRDAACVRPSPPSACFPEPSAVSGAAVSSACSPISAPLTRNPARVLLSGEWAGKQEKKNCEVEHLFNHFSPLNKHLISHL